MASYNPIDKKVAEICKHHQMNLKQFMHANVKEVTTTNSEDKKGASMGPRMRERMEKSSRWIATEFLA